MTNSLIIIALGFNCISNRTDTTLRINLYEKDKTNIAVSLSIPKDSDYFIDFRPNKKGTNYILVTKTNTIVKSI